jgi:hypothetical protein
MKKKKGGDEPIGVIIHICMEISQGNSLCLSQTGKKFFFFYKMSEQEGQNRFCLWERVGTSGRDMGNGNRRVNMMQKLCTHVYKQK